MKTVGIKIHPPKWLRPKRLTIPSVDNDGEQLDVSHIAGGDAKWFGHFGKHHGSNL